MALKLLSPESFIENVPAATGLLYNRSAERARHGNTAEKAAENVGAALSNEFLVRVNLNTFIPL